MSTESELQGPEGTRFFSIEHLDEVGSTNAELLQRASEGEKEGSVMVTDHQTAGRGRQARAWHDEPGNAMLMSVLLRPDPSYASLVPLLAGLAVTDAVEAILGVVGPFAGRVGLKWPNDVLVPELGERKLAGILAEATTVAGAKPPQLAVVVGMGLNITWSTPPPEEIRLRAATLTELAGRPVERWDLVAEVLRGLERWLRRADEAGPAAILEPYRRRCVTVGRPVRFQTPIEVVEGTATGIADTGELIVDHHGTVRTLSAGDVHHL